MTKVFVSHPPDRLAHYFGEHAAKALRDIADVRFNPNDGDLASPAIARLAADCDIIVAYRQTAGDEALFKAMPQLVAFVRNAIDIRTVDVAAASRHGVMVTQASAGFIASVSEWAIGAMVDLGRGMTASASRYHAMQEAPPAMGRQLRGSTLGVIGYGQIGRYLCDAALALGMRVIVHDPHVDARNPGIESASLLHVLQSADFVVCLATATPETENLFDAQSFKAMRQGSFFINASRGELVDEKALLHALDSGHLAGCAIDVGRAPDQMPSPHLASHPLVVATPHIGGLTPPAVEHQAMETVAQVADLIAGRVPQGAVNAEDATRWRARYRGE